MREGEYLDRFWEVLSHIRYVKLQFTIRWMNDTRVPREKVSALRGGVGEMLLRANCIRDRVCDHCDFINECIVQRMMYGKYDHRPEFVTTGESVGYVFEWEDYAEAVISGERSHFQLLLFGKNIVYFSQYLQAIHALGCVGLGKNH